MFEALNELNIMYQLYQHPPVYTMEEWEQYIGSEAGAMCKSLFLRNQKGDKHFLVVANHATTIDLRLLANHFSEKQVSFASEKRLAQYLGLSRGAVSPFGLLNDAAQEVIVALDANLKKYSRLMLHPNVNTETVAISSSDLEKFIQWRGNKQVIMNL